MTTLPALRTVLAQAALLVMAELAWILYELKLRRFDVVAQASQPLISSHVSYLAQTRKSTPVTLDSPECVDGAADADS